MENMWSMEKIWTSWDDAAGESFDKVAKMMWLPYPGWPVISALASEYNETWKNLFPRVWLNKDEFDFSFSGLKSAVKREVDLRIEHNKTLNTPEIQDLKQNNQILLTKKDKIEISYEFQNAVTEVLAKKLVNGWLSKNVKTVMLAWWVSANNKLKENILSYTQKNNLEFIYPIKNVYCMDNAAMVWILAYYKVKHQKI